MNDLIHKVEFSLMQLENRCSKLICVFLFLVTLSLPSNAQYSLAFNANLGEGVMSDTLLVTNDSIALPFSQFTKFGCHFVAWNSQADGGGVLYLPNDSFAIATSDTVLYAVWGKYCGGSGTSLNPWQICQPDALILLSLSPEDWDDSFIQTSALLFSDMSNVDWDGDGVLGSSSDAAGFSPIGNLVNKFSGHYDGQGYSIDSLYIDNSNNYIGLFGVVDDARVENVILKGAEINGFSYIGGIIGCAQNNTFVDHLCFDGIVNGRAFAGGVIGSLEDSEIRTSCFKGELKASGSMAGGLVGRIRSSTILNSYSSGYVLGDLQNIGGMAGLVQDNSLIKNSYSSTGVKGLKYVGSFAGILSGSVITNCYATGVAQGEDFVGGFMGVNSSSTLNACYYDSETTWNEGSPWGLNPLTKEAFSDYATNFTTWDFGIDDDSPWVQSANGRPYLYWQNVAISNGLLRNTDSGYVFSQAFVEDIATITAKVGIRFKSENATEWTYKMDNASAGIIDVTLDNLAQDDYWVQPLASDGQFSYYGDMTRMSLHHLSFDASGGGGFMSDTLLTSKDSISLMGNEFFLSGYDFLSWNTAADGSGVNFLDRGIFSIDEMDTTLYAMWSSRDFSITYSLGGGVNSTTNPVSYTVDSLIFFADPTLTGHSFDAWYAENTFVNQVDSIPLNTKKDTTLYAQWHINTYAIVYDANNGSGANVMETDTFAQLINLATHSFSYEDHTFKYWTTAADGTGDIYYENDIYTYGDSTLNLYAQWQKYCGGYGTTISPWQICSTEALILLSQSPEDWDNDFEQTDDIIFGDSMSGIDWNGDGIANDALGFLPLGDSSTPFSGNYNGNNYSIENLFINRLNQDYVGLFGYATGDTIKQVALVNVNINGRDNTGALIGYCDVETIYNSYSNGLVEGRQNVGGLIGQIMNTTLKNAYSTSGVVGEQNTGGLLGASTNSSVANSYSTGAVMASGISGGFVGAVSSSLFTSCYFDVETSQQLQASGSGGGAGIDGLLTEDFRYTNNFAGWNIGIGIEILPWMPNEEGRPYLVGQKSSVTNGHIKNGYGGYIFSTAYADSILFVPSSTGMRYRNVNVSIWTTLLENNGVGDISTSLSGLDNGDYWVQALSQKADSITYGDMTLMTLATLHFEANGGGGIMPDTTLVVGDSILFPRCSFFQSGSIHSAWNTKADGSDIAFSPKGGFAIGYSDSTLYAQWMSPFATDDYFDGIVGGSRVELDVTLNDTIGGVLYGQAFPIEIIETGTSGVVTIEGNQIIYAPPTTFSGPDYFSYLVDCNGAVDTAEVVILVFDAPGNMVNADCFVDMPEYEWEVKSAGESKENDINVWTTPLIGDLYGDEYPEIVAKKGSGFTDSRVYVYNGSNKPLLSGSKNFNVTEFNAAATTMAIAKVETGSGLRSTLFVAGINRRIFAYNPQDGAVPYWKTEDNDANYYCEELGANEGAFIGVADFNNDNQQEVYAGNRIYNAATGVLLCSGSDTTDIGHFVYGSTYYENYSNPAHHMMHSVTGDFDRDGDLELAAGRYVYDVDIDNGTMFAMAILPDSLSSDPNMIMDGATTLADIDLDGDLDVVVTHQTTRNDFYCYVWDGQSPTLMAEKYIRNDAADAGRYAVGIPFIGDLNGDGTPEIAFTTSNRQYAFSYSDTSTDLQEYYTLKHSDDSGFTGLTLFDFNNDDIAEIVYRDKTELRIINASGISHLTGNDTLNTDGTPFLYDLATYDCYSSTQSEFAVVADVDLDDQAEIIVTNNSRLNIFESGAGSKWVGARPVWNQYGYNVTNVNNDLTIPTYAINNSMTIDVDSLTTVRPFNHFLQQMGNVTLTGENVILTPDLYMSNSFYTNNGVTGTLTFDIINQGDADFSQENSTVSFYCGDPELGGTLLSVDDIRSDILWEDTLKSQVYTFPADPTTCPRIFVRLNDNGYSSFPDSLNLQQECNYSNNSMLAAIFEVTSHFTWNGYNLENVSINTGDVSGANGMAYMLISRGDTIDILPALAGYVFKPTGATLPSYSIHNDTLTLNNVQENGGVSFTAYKVPELTFTPKTVVYDQSQHSANVAVTAGVVYSTYYKSSVDSLWSASLPDSVGYYDVKVVSAGNYLYASSVDSLDSCLVITPRTVTFALDVSNKPYDGTDTVVSFTASHNVLSGDDLYLDADNSDLHFAGINAGTFKVFPSSGWSISGPDAHNYELQPYDTVSAAITKHLLTITAKDSLKLYDSYEFYGGNGVICDGFALGEDTSALIGNLNYRVSASAQGALDVGVYDIEIDGFSSQNYDIIYVDGTLTVEKKFLFIEFRGGTVITYGDSINLLDYASPDVVNLAPGDSFVHQELGFSGDVSTTGNLASGVHKLDLGAAYVQNRDGDIVTSNYNLSFSPENITVLPKEVYIANAIAQSRIYNANNNATIEGATLSGVVSGDMVSLNNFSLGQFIQTDIGNNIEVFHSNSIGIWGSDAANYVLMPFNTSLFADIYPRELTLSGTIADDKLYDGDSIAVVRGANLAGVLGMDDVHLLNDTSGVFQQANAGDNLGVTTAITMGGTKSHNYYLTQNQSLEADILRAPLSISAIDSTKVYDAFPFIGGNGIVWNGFAAGEDTTDLLGSLSFVGNSQSAIDTGQYLITPQGFSATNYDITYIDGILKINPRIINIDYRGMDTITYGQTVDFMDYNPSIVDLAIGDSFIVDFIGFDNDTSSSGQLNVGSRVLTSGNAQILNSAKETVTHNYIFSFNPPYLTVLPKQISVVGASAQDKIYDNTLNAIIDSVRLDGVVGGDDIALLNTSTGVFADENVASNIVVTPDYTSISGSDSSNYILTMPSLLSANITKRPIVYSLDSIADKIYDATDTLVNEITASTNDTIFADNIVLHYSLSFDDANADSDIIISADTWFISGLEINNYHLLPYHGDSANISPKDLIIAANSMEKTYDGVPYLGGNGITWTGFVHGESVANLKGALSYAGTAQGAIDTGYYNIEPKGYLANNYAINYKHDSLHILPRTISVNYGGSDTITYGDDIEMLNYTPVTSDLAVADIFKADSIDFLGRRSSSGQLVPGSHLLDIGDANIVNASQDTVTHNYIFVFNPPTLWVNPKMLNIANAIAEDKIYDKTEDALIAGALLSGVELGDSIVLHQAVHGIFADDDVASGIIVTPDSAYISGLDSANYILKPLSLLQADILPRPVFYHVDTVVDKVYDATDTLLRPVNAVTSDTIASDSITFSFSLAFSNKVAGFDWAIDAGLWEILGAEAHNYALVPYAGDSASILQRDLFLSANDTVKTYDSYRYSGGNGIVWDGFVAGEDTADLIGDLRYSGTSQMALDTGSYEIIPVGFSSNNYAIHFLSDTLRVDPRLLRVSYGGNDTLNYGDEVNMLDYTPQLTDLADNDDFHVGALNFGDEVSESGHLVAGLHHLDIGKAYILNAGVDSVTHNYIFSFNPPSIWVNKKQLSIINATAQNKVYDNTTVAVVDGAFLNGVVFGDDVTLSNSEEGIFADENVNNNILISTDSMLLLGADTANYILAQQPVLMANITPRPVRYILDVVSDKAYDGTDTMIHHVGAMTSDTIFEDSLSLDFTLAFQSVNVGNDWPIIATRWLLQGSEKSNYTLLPLDAVNASITKANLYFDMADTSRFYGQDNPQFSYTIDSFVADEDLSIIDQLPSFSCLLNPKSFVGEYTDYIKLVGGHDNNYNFVFDDGDLVINKIRVDVNYMAEDTLMYGAFVDANDYSVLDGQMVNNDTLHLGALNFGGDISSSGHYTVGEHVILPGEIKAIDENGLVDVSVNYDITFNPTSIVYEPKPVYAVIETVDKEYDGNSDAELQYVGIDGLFNGDLTFLDAEKSDLLPANGESILNAKFENKNVGQEKIVSPVACYFAGDDCHNYTILFPELKANITPRSISWVGNALDKVYDGTVEAAIDTVGLLRTIEGDDVAITYSGASFEQSDAGVNWSILLSNLNLTGSDKTNYDLDPYYNLRATIHKAELLVRLNDFTYIYGDTLPVLTFNYEGFVSGEDASLIDVEPQIISPIAPKFDVGYYTLAIDSASDNNYNISYLSGQAMVLPRPLDISYSGPEKLCANEPVDIEAYETDGLAVGDDLSVLEFDITILKDGNLLSGEKYHIARGATVVRNENIKDVTDNYTVTMSPLDVEMLEVPGPALGKDLEFCGVCEYDFDAGEGISYLWSTGETTRHISMQGNYRGALWVRVGNDNGCFNTDTVLISVESKYLKDFIVAFIYPNPNNGQFKVELSHFVTDIAYIYDMTGNLLKTIDVDGESFDVDIHVPDGAYLLEILDAKEIFIVGNSEALNFK